MPANRTSVIARRDLALPADATQLLGAGCVRALDTVIKAVDAEARRKEWPVAGTQVRVETDPEDHGARTVELVFILDADPEESERVLEGCYSVLEACIGRMNRAVRERLMNTLFFDVEPA